MRTQSEITQVYERHADSVYRVCLLYMKDIADREDAVQNTFLKLIRSGKVFESTEHEKAWLIVAAGSVCKNMLRTAWRRRVSLGSEFAHTQAPQAEADETIGAVMALPDKLKTAVYLHYYEGYSGTEIAQMTGAKVSTVYGYLHKGRRLLGAMLEGGRR